MYSVFIWLRSGFLISIPIFILQRDGAIWFTKSFSNFLSVLKSNPNSSVANSINLFAIFINSTSSKLKLWFFVSNLNLEPLRCIVMYPISSIGTFMSNSSSICCAIFVAVLNCSILFSSFKTSCSIEIVSPFLNLCTANDIWTTNPIKALSEIFKLISFIVSDNEFSTFLIIDLSIKLSNLFSLEISITLCFWILFPTFLTISMSSCSSKELYISLTCALLISFSEPST